MSLLIDVGNTRTKWFLTDAEGVLTDMGAWESASIDQVDIAALAKQTDQAFIAAVGSAMVTEYIERELIQVGIAAQRVQSAQENCGLVNRYQTPESLGVDRWLSLIAAYQSDYGHALVVTAGTAVTMDALEVGNDTAAFIGGTIMPGLRLMQASLHHHTEQLPPANGRHQAFPLNTDDAIHSGALNAIFNAIQYQWKNLYDVVKTPPKLVLSGGDAQLIAEKIAPELAHHMIIVDNLVLRGLMHIEKEIA